MSRNYLLVLFLLFCSSSPLFSQTEIVSVYPDMKYEIAYEKFDMNLVRNKFKGSLLEYSYDKSEGGSIRYLSYKRGTEVEVYETFPAPYVHALYKEFYPNGKLKKKGVVLPNQVRVGKWIEFDEAGEASIVDYEMNRSGFGYNGILEFLESEGYYNSDDKENVWSLVFSHSPGKWSVRASKDGDQKHYMFDDATGEVSEMEIYRPKTPIVVYDYEQEMED